MLSFTIEPKNHCRRLESFLRALLPASPLAYPRKLIKSGAVKLNGAVATSDSFLTIGDRVTIKESTALTAQLSDAAPALDILYEDDQIAIVNKPSGLAMHRTAELEGDLVQVGMDFMARRKTVCKLYPVNRLDRGTSGTVILAKSSSAAGMFGRQVKESGLDKLYLALVWGRPEESGLISEQLDGKESETRYRILTGGAEYSLLAVTPISGRMHQIRRHMEMIGHPVLGDKRYGGGELDGYGGFALHSFRTVLLMPDNRRLVVCAPLPEELLTACEQRGIGVDELQEMVRRLVS